MAFADSTTYMGGDGSIIGSFIEEDFKNRFEFSRNVEADATEDVQRFILEGASWTNTFPHKVWVMDEGHPMRKHDQGFRYARVMKTRAWVVVDEDENGPVLECWKFKNAQRIIYPRSN